MSASTTKSKYKSQIILEFQPDEVISNGSKNIANKHKMQDLRTEILTIKSKSGVYTKEMTESIMTFGLLMSPPIRFYIRGHGNWANQTIGGWSAKDIASMIAKTAVDSVDLVSVTGCNLGRDSGTADKERVNGSMDSFGALLHAALKSECKIKTKLHTRIYSLGVRGDGTKVTWVGSTDKTQHKQPKSKILYYWEGEKQVRKWAYEGTPVDKDGWDVDFDFD